MALHSQADMRDDVRRLLAIVPPIDTSSGAAGALPTAQPDPDNPTINTAINQAIEALNRIVRVGPFTDYTISVPAYTTDKRSVAWVNVSTIEPPGGGVFHATEILDVLWTGTDGNTNRLQPQQYYGSTKAYTQFQQYKPATRPSQFITTGVQIGLLPAPTEAGILTFSAASGQSALLTDTDVPAYIPDDYEFCLVYWAVMLLSAREAQSVEAQSRYPAFQQLAAQSMLQVYQWKNGYDDTGVEVARNILMMTPINTQQQRMQATGQAQGGK